MVPNGVHNIDVYTVSMPLTDSGIQGQTDDFVLSLQSSLGEVHFALLVVVD